MADNVTIETLKIRVVYELGGKNPATSITNIANALNKLQEVSKSLKLNHATNEIANFGMSSKMWLKDTHRMLNDIAKDLRMIQSYNKLKLNFKMSKSSMKTLETYTQNLASALKTETATVGGGQNETGIENPAGDPEQIDLSTTAIERAMDAVNELNSAGKSTSGTFSKLWKSIGRIALYRVVRTAIKLITSAIKDGLDNIAKYSETFANTISELKSIWTQFGNSLATLIAPLLQTLTPILQNIMNLLQPLINDVARGLAILMGQSTYVVAKDFQEVTEAIKEAKAELFSFDEINKASKEDYTPTNDMFETRELTGTDKIAAEAMSLIWENINSVITDLGTLVTIVTDIRNVLPFGKSSSGSNGNNGSDNGGDNANGEQKSSFWGKVKSLMGFDYYDKNEELTWKDALKINSFGKLYSFLKRSIIGKPVDTTNSSAINDTLNPSATVGASGGRGTDEDKTIWEKIGEWALNNYKKIPHFATGGFVKNADLFLANENGAPELVGRIGSQTAVANQNQIIEGIKKGVMEAMLMSDNKEITIQIYNEGQLSTEKLIRASENYNKRAGKNVFSFANN